MPNGTLEMDLDLTGKDARGKPLAQSTWEFGTAPPPPACPFMFGKQNCHAMEAPNSGTNMKFGLQISEPMGPHQGYLYNPRISCNFHGENRF